MTDINKNILMSLVITGCIFGGNSQVLAADKNVEEFTLDPILVTAQRMEKSDLETPATVEVIDKHEIKEAGYKNIFDAVEHQLGMTSTGYGDAGQSFGLSQGRTVIRGFDRGTLVLVDGVPMNLKNYNGADVVPIDFVERIEIVKGAAGTLYGAEAMGGVVNIITKKITADQEKFITRGTYGNYYKDYNVSLLNKDIMLSFGREYTKAYDDCNAYPTGSDTDWWIGKGTKNKAAVIANLSEEVRANLFFSESSITRGGEKYKNNKVDKSYDYQYDDRKLMTSITYEGKDNGVKALLGYNYAKYDGYDYIKDTEVSSNAILSSYIADVQKKWNFDEDAFLAGISLKRENYEGLVNKENKAHRTSNAIYLSYDKKFSDKFSTTLGLRGEQYDDLANNDTVLLPQIQTLYKVTDTLSWYTNVGKAYQTPTIDSYFNDYTVNGLKPEEGWNYETGLKKIDGNKSYKIAVYHMDFKNKFGWSGKDNLGPDGKQYPVNKGDFRNTGVEIEFTNKINDNWKYRLGLGYGNPEIKDPSKKNPEWVQDAGRVDAVAGVTYSNKKLTSDLTFKYLGDREDYSDKQIPYRARLTWNNTYNFDENNSVTLTLNNILNRENYSNKYGNLDLPFNWKVMYTHTF